MTLPYAPLALPAISPTVRRRWEFNPNASRLARVATLLGEADILTSLPDDARTLKDAIEATLTDRANRARSNGGPAGTDLAPLALMLTDRVHDFDVNWQDYAKDQKLKPEQLFDGKGPLPQSQLVDVDNSRLGALAVTFDYDNLCNEAIGEKLLALESWPRLGQTVLDILHRGLNQCTGSLDPANAVEWASHQYWQGDVDETAALADQLDGAGVDQLTEEFKKANPGKEPTLEQLAEIGGYEFFTRKQFDADVPRCFQNPQRQPLKELPAKLGAHKINGAKLKDVFWIESEWPKLRAACARIHELSRRDVAGDDRFCETLAYECVPFLLPMRHDDCFGRIYDDVMQMHFESGDICLDTCSVFLWHDAPTLARAMSRAENYLSLTGACEQLIALLKT